MKDIHMSDHARQRIGAHRGARRFLLLSPAVTMWLVSLLAEASCRSIDFVEFNGRDATVIALAVIVMLYAPIQIILTLIFRRQRLVLLIGWILLLLWVLVYWVPFVYATRMLIDEFWALLARS
ncbi:MAG: hypothetical protein U1A27_07450 [Phycisphaerae bacterium]